MKVWQRISSGKTQARHDYRNVFLKSTRDLTAILMVRDMRISDASILVLGCGYNYPEVVLWSTVSKRVVGIDIRKAFWRDGFFALYLDYRRSHGRFASLARAFVDRRIYRNYFVELRNLAGMQIDEYNQKLINGMNYDGVNLPFSDESFDIVCSNAVLQNVPRDDMPELFDEIARVTTRGGISYHNWHNYYSLSGGLVGEDIPRMCPWGHLLGDPRFDRGVYLNRMYPREIVDQLSRKFSPEAVYSTDKDHNKRGVDSAFTFEGEDLLAYVEKELAQYPRELLLTRGFLFVGTRK